MPQLNFYSAALIIQEVDKNTITIAGAHFDAHFVSIKMHARLI